MTELIRRVPVHVGYIIDGNRRWAIDQGLLPHQGHAAGYEAIKEVLVETLRQGVRYVSCYVFSTENWARPRIEVATIMNLLLKMMTKDAHIFSEEEIKVRFIGHRDKLSAKLVRAIHKIEEDTTNHTRGELLVCVDYGGQQEIADAVKKVVQSNVGVDTITPELLSQYMYEPDVPPCDVIVRTSGEQRLSGFMTWRSAYSEMIFMKKNWPDMTKRDVTAILKEYTKRNRRFGG